MTSPPTPSVAAHVRVERPAAGVALVVVDHPPANSLTLATRRALATTWEALAGDPTVGAVVVTGAGDTAFSAGLDMRELAADFDEPAKPPGQRHDEIDRLVWDPVSAGLWKPVIAAVNGYCLAGGLYLALMCDVRIAAEHATFAIPEVRWSHPAVFAWELIRHLPLNVALELTLWAERGVNAGRLADLGFLNAVVPGSDLLDEAVGWAEEVARMPMTAVAAHKRLLYEAAFPARQQDRDRSEHLVRHLHATADAAEGVRAFLERRDPAYEGR